MKKKLVVLFLMFSFVVVSAVGSASFDKGLIGGTSGDGWVYSWAEYGRTTGGETVWVEALLRDADYKLIGQGDATGLEYAWARTSTVYGLDWTTCHAYGSYLVY